MKFFALGLIILGTFPMAFAQGKLKCQSGDFKVEITSSCRLPTDALDDAARGPDGVDKKSSRIKVTNKNKVISDKTYSCYGVVQEDLVFWITSFESGDETVQVTSYDDWGMKHGKWVDFEPAIGGIDRIECR